MTPHRSATRSEWGTSAAAADVDPGDYATATAAIGNRRERIVGSRTGPIADAVVASARFLQSLRAAADAVIHRLRAGVTPLGWSFAAITPFALAGGYLLGIVELVLLGAAGLVLLATATAYLIGRAPLRLELRLARDRIVAGEVAKGTITATSTARRHGSVIVEIPVGEGLSEVIIPPVGPGVRQHQEFTIGIRDRGAYEIGPARTIRADPFGLVRRELEWGAPQLLRVHPRTIAVPATSSGLIRDLEGNPTRDLSSSDISFHALREYVAGDERRNIHWKASARTGTFMVREFEQTRRSRIIVALSLAQADFADEAEFELGVSTAASLGVRAVRDGRDLSVMVSALTPEYAKRRVAEVRTLPSTTPVRLLDEFAAVGAALTALPIADLARAIGDRATDTSVVFLVVGSTPTLRALRGAAARFPLGVQVIVVVCEPEAVPGIRSANGMTVLTIGHLDDLKSALSRSLASARTARLP
ncbi:DUF58 domain-containing protein [Ruicaihuangia caeni]|uniref:DUF58 domain-containing protein n=1 Tax=Ruicaihuangia caeni TaxID=3042517 RepID=A0AAW6T0Z8_9MICO|nr:DUF58 domain-containing protein [Klugiella sp. YN-L-19]MDI2097491.1 DUF58 domain-containing protein [Klugiella sp. YN-L-19]